MSEFGHNISFLSVCERKICFLLHFIDAKSTLTCVCVWGGGGGGGGGWRGGVGAGKGAVLLEGQEIYVTAFIIRI